MQLLFSDGYKRRTLAVFFGLLFIVGLRLVPDYGLTYDEEMQRVTGEVSLLYVFQQLPTRLQQALVPPQTAALIAAKGADGQLSTYHDRDYGVAFELPAATIEQLLRLHDSRQRFLLRHYLNFIICFAGLLAFYRLAARRYASWRVGLLGVGLLVLSPRLFADFFYNSKDAVFTMLFTVAVATAIPFIKRPSWRTAFWHALGCALAIDVRIAGVLVPAATLVLVGLQVLRGIYTPRRAATFATVYLGALASLTVAFWPYLWEAPVSNFAAALRSVSHYRWTGKLLYQGRLMTASTIPWHYPLVWIGLTVPLLYLAFWAVGMAGLVRRLAQVRTWLAIREADWQDLLFLGLGLAPLGAIILMHSALYNGWRHLYFVYPMLLLIALRGMVSAWHWQAPGRWRPYWQPMVGLAIGGALAGIGLRMSRLHPLENLYFNALAPKPVAAYYETDYWNMSLIEGLTWILQHDQRPHIGIGSNLLPSVAISQLMLPAADRQRLELMADPTQADYYLDSASYPHAAPYPQPQYARWAEDVLVFTVYRLPQPALH
jgi:hypothetical protein